MTIDYCAIHGLLVVTSDHKVSLIDEQRKLTITDPEFLEFLTNNAPFVYETEGPRPTPPVFEFYSTIIASKKEVATGCLVNVLYSASSREHDFSFEWASWVAFEYHRTMPPGEFDYSTVQVQQDGTSESIRGTLAFHEEFDGDIFAVFVDTGSNNSLTPVIHCHQDLSAEIVSFILLNDRVMTREACDLSALNTSLAKSLFEKLDRASGRETENDEFDRFGCCAMEMHTIRQDNRPDAQPHICRIVLARERCVIRWQDTAPGTLKNFLEGSISHAPEYEIPYENGETGLFRFWGDAPRHTQV